MAYPPRRTRAINPSAPMLSLVSVAIVLLKQGPAGILLQKAGEIYSQLSRPLRLGPAIIARRVIREL